MVDRKRAAKALAEATQFNQNILDTSPDIIYLYDLMNQRNITWMIIQRIEEVRGRKT